MANKMKSVETYQLSINWYGKYRVSPEYSTLEEACSKIPAFRKAYKSRVLQVSIVRNVRYVSEE